MSNRHTRKMHHRSSHIPYKWLTFAILIITPYFVLACSGVAVAPTAVPTVTPLPAPEVITVYGWTDDGLSLMTEGFTQEFGIPVHYIGYDSQEEAVKTLEAGQTYDVIIMENQFVPLLAEQGLLAPINHANIPNFRFISPNFRDLAHDPGNLYTVPYSWGTFGLVARTDLLKEPITAYADLWNPVYAGKIVGWESTPRYMIGMTLMSLGYSVNSENPAELEEALAKLMVLKPNMIWYNEQESIAPALLSGEALFGVGWVYDAQVALEENDNIAYILAEEGAILWGDNFVISAKTKHQAAAESFINYVLRPEVSAAIVNETGYASANEAAIRFVDQAIASDPMSYPSNTDLHNAQILLPLSPEGEARYAALWEKIFPNEE